MTDKKCFQNFFLRLSPLLLDRWLDRFHISFSSIVKKKSFSVSGTLNLLLLQTFFFPNRKRHLERELEPLYRAA